MDVMTRLYAVDWGSPGWKEQRAAFIRDVQASRDLHAAEDALFCGLYCAAAAIEQMALGATAEGINEVLRAEMCFIAAGRETPSVPPSQLQ